MKISPFTPLFFDTEPASDGVPSRHLPLWAPTDQIMVQVFCDSGETAPAAAILDGISGDEFQPIEWQSWEMNADKTLCFSIIRGLTPGYYKVQIGELVSAVFRVTDDAFLLSHTTLIQYRFKDNRQRDDVASVINYMPYFFDWRVPGGFKDSGWSFGVTNEQFTTQTEDVVELYATDYLMKTFTLGNAEGIPVWYGEMLNRVLTCPYVYFNRVRYTRNDGETPSINTLVDGLDSFVFTQVLRKAHILDAEIEELNQLILRRIDDDLYRSTYIGTTIYQRKK
jgi:hypothetical protein